MRPELFAARESKEGPVRLPVTIEPSPPNTDDRATLLGIATFNGLCRLLLALGDRGLLNREELQGLEDAMTVSLDDPEWRSDDVIAAYRDTAIEVLAMTNGRLETRKA